MYTEIRWLFSLLRTSHSRKFNLIYIYSVITLFFYILFNRAQQNICCSSVVKALSGTTHLSSVSDKKDRCAQGVCPAMHIFFLSPKKDHWKRILKAEKQIWRWSKACNTEKKGNISLRKLISVQISILLTLLSNFFKLKPGISLSHVDICIMHYSSEGSVLSTERKVPLSAK